MRTFFQTREINEKNFKSGINSKYVFFREIEHSRNLNFSSNQKIDVTIIFQIRETNKKNETSSNQELIQSVFLFRQIPQIWIFLLEKVTSSIDRFLFERQSFHAYIFLNQRDKWRHEWNNETSIPPFDSIFIEHARRRSLPLAKKTNEDETTTRSTFFSSQLAIESTGLEPITLETRPRIFQRSRKWEKIGRRRVKTNFHIVDGNGNSLPAYKGKFCEQVNRMNSERGFRVMEPSTHTAHP